MLDDIAAVQAMYGADLTTRTGDTTYGFHSTADRDVFDFYTNINPFLTIYDAGGHDTLDLSGFNRDQRARPSRRPLQHRAGVRGQRRRTQRDLGYRCTQAFWDALFDGRTSNPGS